MLDLTPLSQESLDFNPPAFQHDVWMDWRKDFCTKPCKKVRKPWSWQIKKKHVVKRADFRFNQVWDREFSQETKDSSRCDIEYVQIHGKYVIAGVPWTLGSTQLSGSIWQQAGMTKPLLPTACGSENWGPSKLTRQAWAKSVGDLSYPNGYATLWPCRAHDAHGHHKLQDYPFDDISCCFFATSGTLISARKMRARTHVSSQRGGDIHSINVRQICSLPKPHTPRKSLTWGGLLQEPRQNSCKNKWQEVKLM